MVFTAFPLHQFFVIISDEINVNYKWLLKSSQRFFQISEKVWFLKYRTNLKYYFIELLFSLKISASLPLFFMSCLGTIGAVHAVCDLNMKVSLMLSDGLFDLKQVLWIHAFQCFSYLLLPAKIWQ